MQSWLTKDFDIMTNLPSTIAATTAVAAATPRDAAASGKCVGGCQVQAALGPAWGLTADNRPWSGVKSGSQAGKGRHFVGLDHKVDGQPRSELARPPFPGFRAIQKMILSNQELPGECQLRS
jgi:hypothetical protein